MRLQLSAPWAKSSRWIPVAVAMTIAGAAAVGLSPRSDHGAVVSPVRKEIIIASAHVDRTSGPPVVRLEVEIAAATGIDPKAVRAMRLYRITVAGVNPMRDHVRGIFSEPLGWNVESMEQIAELPGPATARHVITDNTVVLGSTYVYRVGYLTSLVGGEHFSPLRAIRVHPADSWWPTDRVSSELASLANAFPGEVRVETLGHGGHRGLPIVAVRAGSAEPDAPVVVLIGAIHAGESGPELILAALGKLLNIAKSNATLGKALRRVGILAVPVLNVDERERLLAGNPTYLRLNPQGIDLNRNFPSGWEHVSTKYGTSNADPGSWTYRGSAPLSAIETHVLHDALSKVRIAALLSYHGLYSLSGPELLQPEVMDAVPTEMKDQLKSLSTAWFRGLTKRPASEPIQPVVHDASPGGSLITWTVMTRGAPAFDVEAAGDKRLLELAQSPPNLALLDEYQERHAAALEEVLLWAAGQPD